MNSTILLSYLVIQFAIQLTIYMQVRKILISVCKRMVESRRLKLSKRYCKKIIHNVLFFKYITYEQQEIPQAELDRINQEVKEDLSTWISVLFFILNIAISILVSVFTASGAIAGMTNLGASVLLGGFMIFDINKLFK